MDSGADSLTVEQHEHFMGKALELARQAGEQDEVPVGAVLVDLAAGEIIGRGLNHPIASSDPTAHAEVAALREAARLRGNYRLPGTALYVTIEPCTMCVGALVHARVDLLVFGAREPRAGAVVSRQQLLGGGNFNHELLYMEGVMAGECGRLLQDFFKARRAAN